MQKRMIHEALFSSGQVSKLTRNARLLYIGMIVLGDDGGRLRGTPAFLRSRIFPYNDDISLDSIEKWRDEIVKEKLIMLYGSGLDEFISHPNWKKYQTLRSDRFKDSKLPPPNERDPKSEYSKEFEMFWSSYPRKIGKGFAWKAWKKISGVKKIYEVIIESVEKHKTKDSQWKKEKGVFIPHPATFLNQSRWEDEFNATLSGSGKYKGL